jgi:hypothetical protein
MLLIIYVFQKKKHVKTLNCFIQCACARVRVRVCVSLYTHVYRLFSELQFPV